MTQTPLRVLLLGLLCFLYSQPVVNVHTVTTSASLSLGFFQPLTPRQSHGPITDYEVTLWSSEENLQRTAHIPPDTSAELVNLTQITTPGSDNKITATVVARNTGGESQPASVHIPLRLTGTWNWRMKVRCSLALNTRTQTGV